MSRLKLKPRQIKQQIHISNRYLKMTCNTLTLLITAPAHDKINIKTYVTSKDSDQPVQPPSMTRVFVYLPLNSLVAVEGQCDQRRLWSDCADAQADLSLRLSHQCYCRFCRAWLYYFLEVCWQSIAIKVMYECEWQGLSSTLLLGGKTSSVQVRNPQCIS